MISGWVAATRGQARVLASIDPEMDESYTADSMDEYTLRPARAVLEDAHTVRLVEQASLGDSQYTSSEVLRVLRRPEQYAYLLAQGDTGAAFCSCIETPSDSGVRLEVDMLGVLPQHRGRGLATRLVDHAIAQARRRGVRRFRALVAADNVASRRVFLKAGFQVSSVHDMLLYLLRGLDRVPFLPPDWRWHRACDGLFHPQGVHTPAFSASGLGREVHWLTDSHCAIQAMAEGQEVETLVYRGLWVERLWGASPGACAMAARALAERSKETALDEVGLLWPQSSSQGLVLALFREGFERMGAYHLLTLGKA